MFLFELLLIIVNKYYNWLSLICHKHLSCLTPGGRPHWMLWSLMESFALLISIYRIPHSCSRALRLRVIHVHWRIFTLGEWIPSLFSWKKMPNNGGNEERVASSVSGFCITSHSSVWIHDSVDKAQLSLTPAALIHPYIKALLPLNVTVGTKHFSLHSSSSNTRTFWMLLDLKWLIWSHETRVWIPRSLYFVNMSLGRG